MGVFKKWSEMQMKRNPRAWVLTEDQLAKRRTLPTEGLLFESPAECQTNDGEEASRHGGGINGVTGQRYDRRGGAARQKIRRYCGKGKTKEKNVCPRSKMAGWHFIY